MMDSMENMDEEQFNAFFGNERSWTCVLSNGKTVPLKTNGADIHVTYDERKEYSSKVQQVRMTESDKQV